ncbi:hypothetical protein B0H13DRAFT_2005898 [Mycena leptocephala]|nr:hypothetical protein B0H13DRAFT_2005898 [Mycena leptocephala]
MWRSSVLWRRGQGVCRLRRSRLLPFQLELGTAIAIKLWITLGLWLIDEHPQAPPRRAPPPSHPAICVVTEQSGAGKVWDSVAPAGAERHGVYVGRVYFGVVMARMRLRGGAWSAHIRSGRGYGSLVCCACRVQFAHPHSHPQTSFAPLAFVLLHLISPLTLLAHSFSARWHLMDLHLLSDMLYLRLMTQQLTHVTYLALKPIPSNVNVMPLDLAAFHDV